MLSCPYIPDWTLSHIHNVSVAHLCMFGKSGSSEFDHAVWRIVLHSPSELCNLTALFPVFLKIRPKKVTPNHQF